MNISGLNNIPKSASIAVAMSGGVDSSVSAALLVEAGYKVAGFTLKLWEAENDTHARKLCCTTVMAKDAKRVCSIIGIPHYTLDLRDTFNHEVVARFESEYLAGRTPNPCVTCNSHIKWGALWQKARSLSFDYLATGHYAQIDYDANGNAQLLKGLDPLKDQSYFLWGISRPLLKHTVFPLGQMKKTEVREMARKLNLPVSEKDESQEVCFIPADDYRSWLQSRHPEISSGEFSGMMVDENGTEIGRHDGYPFFTIGQRKGLGLGGGRKLFVTSIDPETRVVTVGERENLNTKSFYVEDLNTLSDESLDKFQNLSVKVRYRDNGMSVESVKTCDKKVEVNLSNPVSAITPGQSAVFYSGYRVVAGGIIVISYNNKPNQTTGSML